MTVPNLTVTDVAPDARIYDSRTVPISAITIHHTGGVNSLRFLSEYHDNPVSIQKLVPKRMPDGNPGHYQIVPDTKRAWHAGRSEYGGVEDWNNCSIGVEIENRGDGRDPYTAEQYETVAQIIAYQCALYHIQDYYVRTHKEVALPRGRKQDTDPTFDLVRLWRRVTEIRTQWPYSIPFWCCCR